MKKHLLFLFLFAISAQFALSQIGHTTFTFNDPSRTGGFGSGGGAGRQIQTEIYYPAATTGNDVAVIPGSYPVIVFGHGFVMSWDAYNNIWEHYVALGYVVAFPRTEGGISPSHGNFGEDLRLVATNIMQLNTNPSSALFNSLNPNSAIIGHSMGGGATILAGANNLSIKAIVGLAPAETNPSAIGAANLVSVPSLIISGSGDGVTPPSTNHTPIYNGLGSSCKSFVSITGGGHCYFANANTNCDFGELTSILGVTINRAQQHARMFTMLDPFLAYHLKEDCGANTTFLASIASNPTGLVNQSTCVANPIPSISQNGTLLSTSTVGTSYQWLLDGNDIIGANQNSFTYTQNGSYQVEVTFEDGCSVLSATIVGDNAGIDEQEIIQHLIYPNPSNGEFYIQNEKKEILEITIYSLLSAKILTIRTNSLIDLTDFPSGTYLLELNKMFYRLVKN